MSNKEFVQKLGFLPKNNANGGFYKKFSAFDYTIEVDFEAERFNFGSKIKSDSGTTLNFSQEENWVVLECVNRLIEKGYRPEDIILEKIYPTGHGTSGRLDILVKKDRKAYLMIECKTWGVEYQKALKKMQKDGGQLFTYFQQDRDAEYLMLYASEFNNGEIIFEGEIVKIEEHYREAGNVKDLYDRWNKLSKSNGVFDNWVNAYEFQNKALTINDLKIIKQEDSSFIFNRFLEILRQNVVSDKSNAFNKIFTLFLCKIVDEDRAKNEQLHFQYLEGEDDNISFQKRLTDLYKRGMSELLEKDIVDMGDEEFKKKFGAVDEKYKLEFLKILTEIRLKKNNEFAFKEVFDDLSFDENAKVVKQVVELLQEYQIRYNKKHQYLGDFFELLLTTGLKQESGQFFTPVPVAKYIIKSLPIREIISDKISKGNPNDLIPFTIDYAAGSGHFLIESMESIQKIIDLIDESTLNPQSAKKISGWKKNQFEWAFDYVYGIEKDYRLVKTAKVGCYLHGDGLAKVIHGDGLGTFNKTPEFRGKLKEVDNDFSQDNKQFDLVISNPPYSVSAFRGNLDEENAKKAFDLFDRLTDQSSEIECLFVERAKQLLKDGGLTGIILPSSILSNAGIYTKTREILFKYFEIIGITELGSGTFMATGTNTVILFLRKRNNYEWENIKSSVEKFFQNTNDVTVNGIENVFSKYVKYVWGEIEFEDYIGLCKNTINKNIENHELYKEYEKKLKIGSKIDLQKTIVEREQEKLLYFILAYNQKVVLTKSGQKKDKKRFLGYEFSNRRGYEGIHPIQRGKSIDECTKMYDQENQVDETKANSYVYKAFLGNKNQKIHNSLEKNIFDVALIDMMIFDRIDFEKSISLTVKKKIKIESKWDIVRIEDIKKEIINGSTPSKQKHLYWDKDEVRWVTIPDLNNNSLYLNKASQFITQKALDDNLLKVVPVNSVLLSCTATIGKVSINKVELTTNQQINAIVCNSRIIPEYLAIYLKTQKENLENLTSNSGVKHINQQMLNNFKIPLPSKNIQDRIVDEIKKLEQEENKIQKEFKNLKISISRLLPKNNNLEKVENIVSLLKRGKSLQYGNSKIQIIKSGQARGYKKFDFSEKHFADEKFVLDERKLQKGDILINSTGVGTAGRITMFDLEGDYVVDSHITILRLDRTKALPDYILYYFCDLGFKTIEAMALGQSGQIELSLETIKNIKIPLPVILEQHKIVAKIEKIEKQRDLLKSNIQEISKQKEEVLKKYL